MRRFVVLINLLLVVVTTVQAQIPEGKKFNAQIDALLKTRQLGDVANEFSRRKTTSVPELLKSIVIFARAGQKGRVRDTLVQLSTLPLPDTHPDKVYLTQIVRSSIDSNDLFSQRLFYERFAVSGDDRATQFVELWRTTGDVQELESWLAARSVTYPSWWDHFYSLKSSLGTSDELIEPLADKVRANPTDEYWITKYLGIAAGSRDVSWLLGIIPSDSSFAAYELATILGRYKPDLAIMLFERSLSLPFTPKDETMFGDRAFRYASIRPIVKDPEKQLRYWTLYSLARMHTEAGRPDLAQPLAERLTAMDISDIQTSDPFRLAGAVQMSSGQRVIESKILQSEATKREQPEYWLERAEYYSGRNEPESVFTTLRHALEVFPYSPGDSNGNRLRILAALSEANWPASLPEVEEILRAEFSRDNVQYQFAIARMLPEDLSEEYFVNTSRLPLLLAARALWGVSEESLVWHVLRSSRWEPEKREAVARELARLAHANIRGRAYSLAKVFEFEKLQKHAVSLLEECRKIAPRDYEGKMNFTREDIDRALFEAYLETGDWRKAKKMYDGGYKYWGNELGLIAAAAAESGNTAEAFRIWQINANLDRRKLEGIRILAKTPAKPLLRDFYQKLKLSDPLSCIPDIALEVLN